MKIIQLDGYQLFWCSDCKRYLNTKYYDKKCSDAHTAIDRNSCSYKCPKHQSLYKNCRYCNPYNCPCGRVVANNKYTVPQHELTKFHKQHNTRS